jgi:hypothetical protein
MCSGFVPDPARPGTLEVEMGSLTLFWGQSQLCSQVFHPVTSGIGFGTKVNVIRVPFSPLVKVSKESLGGRGQLYMWEFLIHSSVCVYACEREREREGARRETN